MPTNHERMIWGLGTSKGLTAIPTSIGRVGGLICWENMMPLARFACTTRRRDLPRAHGGRH